jgi:GNAT superfamily N-acetyltransferase
MTEMLFQWHSGEQTLAMLKNITDLYDEIYSENPDGREELFSLENFIARTNSQARSTGFELVTAALGDILVGFSFGLPFPPGVWWIDCTPAPQEVLNSSKFAVIELNVRQPYRGRGIGKKLLGMLLSGRGEKFATLASIPGSPAHAMYIKWGWYKVGVFEDSPPMDAMLIPLKD